MNPLYILGVPLGYVMEWIYKLIPNYGWDIILFTLLINIVKTPLQLNQQKNTVRMSAFQPMIADIQKKYKDKPDKQQEELMKLQQDLRLQPHVRLCPHARQLPGHVRRYRGRVPPAAAHLPHRHRCHERGW